MKENGLIRCLRDHVKPRFGVFLDPTLSGYLVPWDVFYISGIRIHSIVRRLIVVVTVITVPSFWLFASVRPAAISLSTAVESSVDLADQVAF